MDDGIFFPIIRLVVESKPFEQLFFSFEDGLQRRDEQRFPETPWTCQEISCLARTDEIPDELRLVNVEEIAFDHFLECINKACQFFFHIVHPAFKRTCPILPFAIDVIRYHI